jgi:CheY-like chemotaxis protein
MEQQASADATHILIVDDSLRARLLVETLLRAQGYRTDQVWIPPGKRSSH